MSGIPHVGSSLSGSPIEHGQEEEQGENRTINEAEVPLPPSPSHSLWGDTNSGVSGFLDSNSSSNAGEELHRSENSGSRPAFDGSSGLPSAPNAGLVLRRGPAFDSSSGLPSAMNSGSASSYGVAHDSSSGVDSAQEAGSSSRTGEAFKTITIDDQEVTLPGSPLLTSDAADSFINIVHPNLTREHGMELMNQYLEASQHQKGINENTYRVLVDAVARRFEDDVRE